MRNPLSFLRIAVLVCILCGSAGSRASAQAVQTAPDSLEYQRLVSALRSGERDIDFTRLRMAYAASPAYDPYGGDPDLFRAMMAAVQARRHSEALVLADSVLARNYLDATAHLIAWMSARQSGNEERAPYHAWVARELVRSIASKDGRTPETAMVVIAIDEEYAYLRANGLEPVSQAMSVCGGNRCDVLRVRDGRSGEEFSLYFDVSIPRNRVLQRMPAP